MTDDRWRSPLGSRYASPAMQTLWGERHRIGLWRRLWLALAEAERELGLDIPEQAIAQMRAHLDDADLAARGSLRAALPPRRDGAHPRLRRPGAGAPGRICTSAPPARSSPTTPISSSCGTACAFCSAALIAVLGCAGAFATRNAGLPCLAYTHFQPAQLTTVGKRATLWMQDFALDVEEICRRIETLRFRGCKGTTGTQASFLELFKGDDAKVRELDRRVTAKMGFDRHPFRSPARPIPARSTARCWIR